MRLGDFRELVERLARDIPPEFQGGVVSIEVSPKTVPDPLHRGVYTLGECVPLQWSGDGADLQSRVILYHGSFAELAQRGASGFDWQKEAWETLTHELRHHLEWRANETALEAYDWAAEQNILRGEGKPFDPVFFRSGNRLGPGVYKVDDDVFIERERAKPGEELELSWHGRRYAVTAPQQTRGVWLLTLEGLANPPAGDAILALVQRPSLIDLFRKLGVGERVASVEPLDA